MIHIYHDIGSSETCFSQMINGFRQFSPNLSIEQIKGEDVRSRKYSTPSLICFGGGYDLGYLTSLQRVGCEILRTQLQIGCRYLGLCAGAYFASDYCLFDVGGPLEVVGPRFIGLFKGQAVGPIYPGFEYNSEKGARAVHIEACLPNLDPSDTVVYYNGGCTFESDDWEDSRVLYRYTDNGKPAIIASRLGSGWGILSGVHFEYDSNLLPKQISNQLSEAILHELQTHEQSRLKLFEYIVTCLLDPLFDLRTFNFSTE